MPRLHVKPWRPSHRFATRLQKPTGHDTLLLQTLRTDMAMFKDKDQPPDPKIEDRLWHILLTVMFRCARFVFTTIKMPIKGALVAIWDREKILLVRKSYQKGWSVPGGLLKKGETRKQAAAREAFEETGVLVSEEDLVFVAQVPGDLGPRDSAHLFEVSVNGPVQIKIDGREIVEAEFVAPIVALERDINESLAAYLRAHANG